MLSEAQKLDYARRVLHNIENRIAHSLEHADYDSVYVDLLAIMQYIQREVTHLEGQPPQLQQGGD